MEYEGLSALEIYKKIRNDIQNLYRSRLQTEILLSLSEGGKTLLQLREITGSSSQSVIPRIRKLEAMYLLEKHKNEYRLTPSGKIIASRIADFSRTLVVMNKHSKYWANHYLEGIPEALLNEIGDIFDFEIIHDTNVNIFNVYSNYLKIVKEAGKISGISPIMHPGLADALGERIIEGISVELIVSRDVALQLKHEPYLGKIKVLAGNKNFRLMVTDEKVRLGLTVTDKCLSLGLYKKDGVTYDTTTDLSNFDRRAIEWGERLFEYYKKRADILNI